MKIETSPQKVQLVHDPELPEGLVLVFDGKPRACPYFPPMVVPPRIQGGSPEIRMRPCGSWCALFEILVEDRYRNDGMIAFTVIQKCCSREFVIKANTTPETKPETGPTPGSGETC